MRLILHAFLSSVDYLLQLTFTKKILSGIQSVSNSLDPNHGPDLGPNYLQRLSADDKSCN